MTLRQYLTWGWGAALVWMACQAVAQTAASPLLLSAEERAYVQRQGRIRLCVDPDWEPFEKLDVNGRHVGIAADLIHLVSQRTGLVIEPLVVSTWEESLAASRSGRCQAMSFLNQTPEREAWLNFTSPIFTDPNVLITREEHPYIADLKGIEGETVAIPRGTMVEERIRRDFPLLKVVTTTTEAEAIEMVSDRRAAMTIRSLIVAAYTIKHEGLFNLKIAGQVPEYRNALRMGAIKTEPLLLGVLDKGVQSITPQEREAISNRHVVIEVRQGLDQAVLWKLAAAFVGVMGAAAFWHRKLRQLDRERAALAEARVEEALRAQREQSQLTALLSHEVRTALSIIDGAAGSLRLLLRQDDQPALLRVQRIRDGVQRMQALAEQFLVKDRLESKALKPHLMDLDALALCRDVVQSLDDQRRVSIKHEGSPDLKADPDLLQVAIRNLLVNALRYTPVDSPVILEVRGEPGRVVVRVCDAGSGIAPDEQERIFTPYVRGAQGHGQPGSGLGLHLVRRVAELHGGEVFLESSSGQGSCFSLHMPRA